MWLQPKYKHEWIIFGMNVKKFNLGFSTVPEYFQPTTLTTSEYIIFHKHLIVMTCYWISCGHLLNDRFPMLLLVEKNLSTTVRNIGGKKYICASSCSWLNVTELAVTMSERDCLGPRRGERRAENETKTTTTTTNNYSNKIGPNWIFEFNNIPPKSKFHGYVHVFRYILSDTLPAITRSFTNCLKEFLSDFVAQFF